MAIFPPGAGIVKGTAIVPLTRSQVVLPQRCDKHKVNVAIRRRQQIHYLRMCHSSSLTGKHYSLMSGGTSSGYPRRKLQIQASSAQTLRTSPSCCTMPATPSIIPSNR
ncbi:hypothetical protein F0327_15555 [Citrobacter braakii]|nr:hypothetical protein F0327_15555 [Citrobacter braakii]TCC95200.1 hypothetical protein EY916_01675 [Citrobacter braakii]TKV31364.1 hypothetical protein FDX20_15565 [Citrobacter sp. TBCS-11]